MIIYAGTFDPPTLGHIDLVKRALTLWPDLAIVVVDNSEKHPVFSSKSRIFLLKKTFPEVIVKSAGKDIILFCRRNIVRIIIRGLRSRDDYFHEQQLEDLLRLQLPSIEVIYLIARNAYRAISSSEVRRRLQAGSGVRDLVGDDIAAALLDLYDYPFDSQNDLI